MAAWLHARRAARQVLRVAAAAGAAIAAPSVFAERPFTRGDSRGLDTRRVIGNLLTGDGVLFKETTGVGAERGRELLSNMAIFSGTSNRPLADEISYEMRIPLSQVQLSHYSDGEISVQVGSRGIASGVRQGLRSRSLPAPICRSSRASVERTSTSCSRRRSPSTSTSWSSSCSSQPRAEVRRGLRGRRGVQQHGFSRLHIPCLQPPPAPSPLSCPTTATSATSARQAASRRCCAPRPSARTAASSQQRTRRQCLPSPSAQPTSPRCSLCWASTASSPWSCSRRGR